MGSTPADLKRDPEFNPSHDELAELRALLLGQQIVELQALQKRLDDPNLRAEETSQILASAMALALRRDQRLQRAFHPIVEQALQISVTRNPRILATALAPIIGDAVRKAVANAFRTMADSINFTLQRSLSWESMKWRMEALRTGQSFGQIALLRSLRYKVQQVFLIHRETGLVLQHLSAPGEGVSEAELVSGMLTAIQDFVRDSFTSKNSQDLETMQAGEFTIWVHHGPQALLAGTIMGNPPPELRNIFARENELIHQKFSAELAAFNGDDAPFEATRPYLQKCLLGQTVAAHRQRSWWFAGALAALLVVAIFIGWGVYSRVHRWHRYLTRLRQEPGIVLTGYGRSWSHYTVRGLRDPLAADPSQIAVQTGMNPERMDFQFQPYQSLDERFQRQRNFDEVKQSLEESLLLFPVNSSAITAEQSVRLDSIEILLAKLLQSAGELGRHVHVIVYGRADQTGPETKNATLSRERADHVLSALRERGVPADIISTVGLGDSAPIHHGSASRQMEVNRSVSLKVESSQHGEGQ